MHRPPAHHSGAYSDAVTNHPENCAWFRAAAWLAEAEAAKNPLKKSRAKHAAPAAEKAEKPAKRKAVKKAVKKAPAKKAAKRVTKKA